MNARLPEKYRYIVVEGPVGAGKTSLARVMGERTGGMALLEDPDANPFLPGFYQDRMRYALPAQLFFLFQRARQIEPLKQGDMFNNGYVADFLLDKDKLFARANLDDDELRLYEQVYAQMSLHLPVPDLVIYLQAPVEVLHERMRRRGVDYERQIDREYLQLLVDAYTQFFHHYTAAPLLVVNAERMRRNLDLGRGLVFSGQLLLELTARGPCRPFDAERDGISIGEGAGFALLERKPAAAGAAAALLGIGESSDAYHMSTPHPEGLGAKLAMTRALESAGLGPSDVDYVNLHGTGTRTNDAAEDRAVSDLFNAVTPCSSTKGATGHLLGAAGITEAIICILSIGHDLMPGSANTRAVDPEVRCNYLVANREGIAAWPVLNRPPHALEQPIVAPLVGGAFDEAPVTHDAGQQVMSPFHP